MLAQQDKLATASILPLASAADAAFVRHAISAAFVYGFRWVMLIAAAPTLASSCSGWRMIDRGMQQARQG